MENKKYDKSLTPFQFFDNHLKFIAMKKTWEIIALLFVFAFGIVLYGEQYNIWTNIVGVLMMLPATLLTLIVVGEGKGEVD